MIQQISKFIANKDKCIRNKGKNQERLHGDIVGKPRTDGGTKEAEEEQCATIGGTRYKEEYKENNMSFCSLMDKAPIKDSTMMNLGKESKFEG